MQMRGAFKQKYLGNYYRVSILVSHQDLIIRCWLWKYSEFKLSFPKFYELKIHWQDFWPCKFPASSEDSPIQWIWTGTLKAKFWQTFRITECTLSGNYVLVDTTLQHYLSTVIFKSVASWPAEASENWGAMGICFRPADSQSEAQQTEVMVLHKAW